MLTLFTYPTLFRSSKLSAPDLATLESTEKGHYDAYPVYGLNCPVEVALAVKHPDGNMTLDMAVKAVERKQVNDGELTVITLKDKV